MLENKKIYVAGHQGLVGSAIVKELENQGYTNIVYRSHAELDLEDGLEVKRFFDIEKPQYVILAAAHVGGIMANSSRPADFIYKNLQIQQNVIGESFRHNVAKLLFLGSTCIYPKFSPQPIVEECLLSAPLEPTNEPYAIAKIAGLKLCEAFNKQYGTNYIAIMPTNLYGINDRFDLVGGHILPSIIRKFHLAHCLRTNDEVALRSDLRCRPVAGIIPDSPMPVIEEQLDKYGITASTVTLWGSGRPMREFLWSGDMAKASVFMMHNVDATLLSSMGLAFLNAGSGKECTIAELARLVMKAVGYDGELRFDNLHPDGTPRKLSDSSRLNKLGWKAEMPLEKGIELMYDWYRQSVENTTYGVSM